MYFGSPPSGAIDTYARQAISTLQQQVRELQRQVAELQAALAARDETPAGAG